MKLSIRTLLTVPFIVLTLAPVAVVGWLFHRSSQNAVEQSVESLFEQISSRTEDQIKLYLATPHFINQLNANAITQGLLQVDNLEENSQEIRELETYFYEQVQAADEARQVSNINENASKSEFEGSINHIYLGTVDGIFRGAEYRPVDRNALDSELIAAISRGETEPGNSESGELLQYRKLRGGEEELLDPDQSEEDKKFALFERPWYKGGLEIWESEVDGAGWTDPYCDKSTSRPAITAFRPVGIEDNLIGVLGSDFLFDDIKVFLQQLLSNIEVAEGYILVFDKENERLLISTSTDSKQCDSQSGIQESDFQSDDPIINAFLDEFVASTNSASALKSVDLAGTAYYWDSVEIVDPYGLKLSVLIAVPRRVFTESIDASTRTTWGLAVGTLVLTAILGLLISRWITQPVLELDGATQKLTNALNKKRSKTSDSEEDSWQPISIDNPSELHTLANTFGDMSTRLIKTLAAFGLFVPQNFLDILGHEDATEIERGAYKSYKTENKQMTILFSDIRSFTKLSEAMEPDQNFEFINSYLDRMEPAIRNNHGFIDKYIGDAIMALFADEENTDRKGVENAVKAALGMLQALNKYNVTRNSKERPPIKIGIGLHTGKEITLGVLGGKNRWDTTVIGRDVNKASRVEGLTKQFGSSFLVSRQVIDHLQQLYPTNLQQVYPHRYLGSEPVRGIEEPVDIYEIYREDAFELFNGKQETASLFQEGVDLYRQQNYRTALEKFEAVLAICPSDGAAQYYAQLCREHLGENA